jgi:hypothetical protein
MPDSLAKQDWVLRVLGVALPPLTVTAPTTAPTAPAPRPADLLPLWVAAKEQVDSAISQLQDALKTTGDVDLQQIAEFGLHGVTRNQNVQIMAALREMAAGTPAGPEKLAAAVDDFRELLAGPLPDLLEDTPFGVTVPLRTILRPALDRLEAALGG